MILASHTFSRTLPALLMSADDRQLSCVTVCASVHCRCSSVAGVANNTFNATTGEARFGDCQDVATSLNEAFLWFPFHANLIRAFMIWQRAIAAAEPQQADPSVLWGYPREVNFEMAPYVWPGGELDAELSPLVPFKGVFQGAEPKRITHRFVLQRLMDPEWTYDRMSFGDQV